MKNIKSFLLKSIFLILIHTWYLPIYGQKIIEEYGKAKVDSLRIGKGNLDFLPFIQKGYTLALPESKNINGVIIFLEDSGFDKKNKSAKQIYNQANEKGFAVLSVSTEIPLDFYFSNTSILDVHTTIIKAFKKYNLPNKNVFFIGTGLSGHRALKYVEFVKKTNQDFILNILGLVICDAAIDWVRQYNEGARDIRINFNEGSVGEGTLTTYLLSQHLNGTPKTNLENYLNFSPYSYFDETSRHIKYYKDYAVRVYIQEAIQYWLQEKRKTPFDNNAPDMVGLIAELKLAGNEKSDLVIIYPEDNKSEKRNVDGTWTSVDKTELIDWIIKQME